MFSNSDLSVKKYVITCAYRFCWASLKFVAKVQPNISCQEVSFLNVTEGQKGQRSNRKIPNQEHWIWLISSQFETPTDPKCSLILHVHF